VSRWPAFLNRRALGGISYEILLLIVLCLASVGLLGFASLISEVKEGETHGFDDTLLLALRTPGDLSKPIGPLWLEAVFRDISSLGSPTVVTLITALALGYLLLERKFSAAVLVLLSVSGAALMNTVVKDLVGRPRPDIVGHLVDVHTLSFPSGHAALSAVTYLTLGALIGRQHESRRVRVYVIAMAILVTLLVGCSRVYLGVHWPTDVLAGWCVGSIWAVLCLTWSLPKEAERRSY
jgi:undecaprenyl-diphosphatase